MNYPGSKNTNRIMGKNHSDSIETEKPASVSGTLSSFAKDTTNKVTEGFADMGKGIFDQLIGNYQDEKELQEKQLEELQKQQQEQNQEEEQPKFRLEGGNLFDYRKIEEEREMVEIKQTIEHIEKQVDQLKKVNKEMMQNIKDVEADIINEPQEKQGIYHLFRLRRLSDLITQLTMNVKDSNLWLEAFKSKRAKRGSAFAARSKKAGTSYSMSQELSNARSVQ